MNNYEIIFKDWWYANPPISLAAKAALLDLMGGKLPHDYLDFLEWSDGGEGDTGVIYITLWKSEDLQRLNEGYDIEGFLPGSIAIGDDGPNFIFFDVEKQICRTPFGYGRDDLVEVLAPGFAEFCNRIKAIDQ
ncbi:MAG: SMI1/KNR4 family protein [Verrucomicrobiaceae bacterium]|nr:MAG: SMI1/KNR4 family protein [Verrucomicrobiaceae bacterium]